MAQNIRPANDQRSLGELFGDLSREISTLFRQEVQLARVEITSKLPKLGKDIGFLVIGGAVAYTGVLALVATAIIAAGLCRSLVACRAHRWGGSNGRRPAPGSARARGAAE